MLTKEQASRKVPISMKIIGAGLFIAIRNHKLKTVLSLLLDKNITPKDKKILEELKINLIAEIDELLKVKK